MFLRKRLALSFLTLSVSALLCGVPSYAHRSVGTRASSNYGQAGGQSLWDWTPQAQSTVNGISVSTETVCSGGTVQGATPRACNSTFVFLYQIPSGPNNLVVTFTGLSRFAFNTSFGILYCDPSPAMNMLCTDLGSQQPPSLDSLNIGWDAIGGDLILTVPSVPTGATLTFYIEETPNQLDPSALVPPTMNLGGAVIVPSGLTFGSQESNTASAPQTVTVENSGDFSTGLKVTNISNPTNFVSSGGCAALDPGAECALSLSFSPTTTGNLSGVLGLTDDSPFTNEAINLNGIGTNDGVTLSSSNLVFGNQTVGTKSDPLSVTITDAQSNTQSLQIGSILASTNPETGLPDFAQTNDCSTAVAPGSNCTVQITFSPTISGSIGASMTISDSSSTGSHTIDLSGNGTEVNTATASPSSLDFGTQNSGGTSAAQAVTVTNVGSSALTVVAVNPTVGFAITADKCSSAGALNGGSNCTVSLAFAPTLAGPYTGTLTVADDANGGTLVIPLTGTGLAVPAATPTFSPGAGTYSSIQTVTISDSTPGASIYFTTDGTTPTPGSTLYASPITVSKTETINAIAGGSGFTVSAVASALYSLNLPPPSFSISGTAATIAVGATTGNTSTVTVTPAGGFTGSWRSRPQLPPVQPVPSICRP